MDSKLSKMKTIVAKLLRQAEDVVGTPEEGVFQAKAFELMAKYGIEQAEVEAKKAGLDLSELPDAVKKEFVISGAYAFQQATLLHNIVISLHGKSVWSSRTGTLIAFAVPRHMERIEFLWELLRPQMLRLVKVVRPEEIRERYGYRRNADYTYERYVKSGSGQVKSFRRAWIAGFGQAIGDRIREQEKLAVEGSSSGALVLYKDDSKRAEVALRAVYPRLGKASGARYNQSGYAAGQSAGRQASFQRSIA